MEEECLVVVQKNINLHFKVPIPAKVLIRPLLARRLLSPLGVNDHRDSAL